MDQSMAGIKAMLLDAEEDLRRQLANAAKAANAASDAESHYNDMHARLLDSLAHAGLLEQVLEEERRAHAAQLRVLEEEMCTLAARLEEKDRVLEQERCIFAVELEEKGRALEFLEEERRALAVELEENDRALDAGARALAAQVEGNDRALEAENRALAAQLEEKNRALEAERRALAVHASARGASKVMGQGVSWQYCVNSEWIEMPSECALELTRRYQAGTSSGGDDATSTFSCQSGTEQYEFNLRAMLQRNVRTLTHRSIRCVVHCPTHWTRCTSIDAIQKAGATLTRTVDLKGFDSDGRDGVYVESACDSHGGKALWWKHDGTRYIQWDRKRLAWQMCSVGGDYLQRRNGNGVFDAETMEDPDHGGSWTEKDMMSGWWSPANKVQSTVPAPVSPISPFMNIVAELLDRPTRDFFRRLLFDTAVHQQPQSRYDTRCTAFRDTFKIVRVLRVENWNLLTKYRTHIQHMKQDLEKYGIRPTTVEPQLPCALDETFTYYGGGDASINECFLFHGTSSQIAASIAQEGFDFRVASAGYYGRGTYFASQSCKSFQYARGGGDELCTIIVTRVALGDIMYAPKVDKQRNRPELRDGTLRCYDSIVANPGPMPGHQRGQQTHQEFVIFEKFQAYPEFLVQFTCSA